MRVMALGAAPAPPLLAPLTSTFARALLASPDPLARAFGAAILLRCTLDTLQDAITDLRAAFARL